MEVANVYQTAKEAQVRWSSLTIAKRLNYIRRFGRLLASRSHEYAAEIEMITGKPSFESLTGEILPVLLTISQWEKGAERQLKPHSVSTPLLLSGRSSRVEYRPVGVVLVIAPWNYPLQLTLLPVLSALLSGNGVILKPSEYVEQLTPLLKDLFCEAEFPPGLVQIISGDGSVGSQLVEGEPDLIFFTGSVETGKKIQKSASERLIPTILELGGKDCFLVLEDANLERAVQGALWSSYTNCGQVCLGTERILVQEAVYDRFLTLFKKEAASILPGRLNSVQQATTIRAHLEDALNKGARLLTGPHPSEWGKEELTVAPWILVDVKPDMIVMQEESFGPLVSVQSFADDNTAVNLANSTKYGLGASIWSKDLVRAEVLASQLEAGNISINDALITVANPYLPFGGVKLSGLGSYRGEDGLRAFCTPVAVMKSKGKRRTELNWYPYSTEKEELVRELIGTIYGGSGRWWDLLKRALKPGIWFS